MATYININGNNVPIRASDPSNPILGEIWYNTTTSALKGQLSLTAAFSTSGTVPQIVRGGGSGGTPTAAWLAGGLQYPGDTKNLTWTYNGSTWTSGNNIPANYFIGGSTGPDAAGLLFDGSGSYGPGTATYEWDGTNWTAGGALPALGPGGNSHTTGAGTQTAALCIGGIGDPPPSFSDRVIDYNGASWTTGISTPLATGGTAADGPETAAWIGGGSGGTGMPTKSFEFNGASWTASGDIGTALPQALSAQGWGPQTAAIIGGGTSSAPTSTISQVYDGTSWSTGATMSVTRQNAAYSSQSAGTQTGWIAGGYETSGNTDATEEFQAAGPATVSITAS